MKRFCRALLTTVLAALLATAFAATTACGAIRIGARFPIDPKTELKVGHDQKTDVVRKMGQPYRSFVDSQGHEIYTYVWADGQGAGQKCVIAFNANDVVYLVEVAP